MYDKRIYISGLVVILMLAGLQATAQFPSIKWEYSLEAPAFGSPAAADLDGDGFYEIVFTTYTNDGHAHCLNAEDGSLNWTFDLGGCGDVAALIHDVNGDDTLDVIVNGSCNPTIYCINGITGREIWSHYSGGGDSPPTVADVDGDQRPEVLFGNFSGQIRILNGEDGSINKIIEADVHNGAIQTAPTLLDIDGNGSLEILAGNYFNINGLRVWAFDYASGSSIWTNTQLDPDASFHAYHGGVVADVDRDGKMEYVVGSGAGFVLAINTEDGSDAWKAELGGSAFMAISIADLDRDDQLEVICNNSGTFDNRIWILDGNDGSVEWSYPIRYSAFRGISLSDIDGNGTLDLVSGHFLSTLRVIEPYAGPIWELDLSDHYPPNLPYHDLDVQPLIADFDHNGTSDIFIIGGYGTYEPDDQNFGVAFLIEAGEGHCPEWLMFRHDELRTSYLSPEQVREECGPTAVIEPGDGPSIPKLRIYPNPGTGHFTIAFHSPLAGSTSVSVVNPTLVEMYSRQIGFHPAGDRHISIDLPGNLPAGIYFARIRQADRIVGYGRFSLVRE